ncbi:MAG TPA: response regulator [Polyangiaceae bacterium]|nr:response regulator [Polyangiaceae bacterium]
MTLGAQNGGGEVSSRSKRPTIVVVDDCEVTLASTADILERNGYRVITRDRPAGCVAMMLQEKPDLVLLDVCMPTVSGDTLVKLFSKASPNSGTIILLYSALDEPLLRSKAKGAGAHGYITKSNDSAALLRAIRRWLRPSLVDQRVPVIEPRTLDRAPESSHSSGMQPAPVRALVSHSSAAFRRALEEPGASRMRDVEIRSNTSGEMRRTSGAFQIGAPTVLFVDDDMLVLSGYRRQLFGQPFEFDFALSGNQALRLLLSPSPPSIIVSDLLMPEPNGYELLRRALDLDPSWGRRFIVVTALSAHDAKSQLDSRFAGALLRKPVETDALSAAIRASLLSMGVPLAAAAQ